MAWKYGLIPFDSRGDAVGIFGIVTKRRSGEFIVNNVAGEIKCEIVEHLTWKAQQTNFLTAKWNGFFNDNPGMVDDFIKSATKANKHSLGELI